MLKKYINLFRIVTNPKITMTPLVVLKELQRKGKRKLPGKLDGQLKKKRVPILESISFLYNWLRDESLTRHNGQWVVNSFLPPLPGRSFNRMYEYLLSGKKYNPVSAFLGITKECPYNCWHCSIADRDVKGLDKEQWLKIIDNLLELGTVIIGFTGGEPASHKHLDELVKRASDGGATTILFTAGGSITEELVQRLKEAGLWGICTSLDTTDEDHYNELRGNNNAFKNALNTIQLSVKYGFYTMTGAIAKKSLLDEQKLLDLHSFTKKLNVDEIRIVEPMPCGKLTSTSSDHLLNSKDKDVLINFHKKMNRQEKKPKICAFNHIEGPEVFGCTGGTQHMYIDPSGNMCPCDFTPMSFGNVVEDGVEAVWDHMTGLMKKPRCKCFVQEYYKEINKYSNEQHPLSPERSEEIIKKAKDEPLPKYYKMVMGGNDEKQSS